MESELSKPYKCESCDKTFFSQKELRRHVNVTHLNLRTKCDICNQEFIDKRYVAKHILVIHGGKKPYSCDICKKNFNSATSVRRHKRNVHKIIPKYLNESKESNETMQSK